MSVCLSLASFQCVTYLLSVSFRYPDLLDTISALSVTQGSTAVVLAYRPRYDEERQLLDKDAAKKGYRIVELATYGDTPWEVIEMLGVVPASSTR